LFYEVTIRVRQLCPAHGLLSQKFCYYLDQSPTVYGLLYFDLSKQKLA